MKELSIFVDESGDWGEYDYHSPFYIVSLVIHDQSYDLTEGIRILNEKLDHLGFNDHCIHSGPIIRGEEEFRNLDFNTRKKIFMTLISFLRNEDIRIKTIHIEKKNFSDNVESASKLSKQIAGFIKTNYDFFLGYNLVKVYYDNGQIELNKILSSVFNALLDNVEFRRVLPKDYILFQVADMACTLALAELKMNNHTLSKSELFFFKNERTLRKNYLKPLHHKRFDNSI